MPRFETTRKPTRYLLRATMTDKELQRVVDQIKKEQAAQMDVAGDRGQRTAGLDVSSV